MPGYDFSGLREGDVYDQRDFAHKGSAGVGLVSTQTPDAVEVARKIFTSGDPSAIIQALDEFLWKMDNPGAQRPPKIYREFGKMSPDRDIHHPFGNRPTRRYSSSLDPNWALAVDDAFRRIERRYKKDQ